MNLSRLMQPWVLMEEAASADGVGTSASGGGDADAATTVQSDAALTPPTSLLQDKPETPDKPDEPNPDTPEPKAEEPIKYEPFVAPEGVELDAAKVEAFTAIAAEAKLPQEVAQKFVDLYTAELKQLTEAPMRAWTTLQNEWQEQVRNDPVIGGANLDKNLANTKAGLNALLGEDAKSFYDALNFTGAGNNPAILKGLMKAAAPHAPASPVAGSPAKPAKTAGATLYPSMAGLGNGHEG